MRQKCAFQSTLPTRGSDCCVLRLRIFLTRISIHAPHEGERPCRAGLGGACMGISIHAPHEGERPLRFPARLWGWHDFNPRSPRGGATHMPEMGFCSYGISIHAPHEGERLFRWLRLNQWISLFQSTLPTRGSDAQGHARDKAARTFQSTLPTRGSDDYMQRVSLPNTYFNPRSPRGGATYQWKHEPCLYG